MNVNFSFFSKVLVCSWFGFFCFSANEKYIFFEVEGIKDSKENYFVISEDWAKSKSFITELKSKGYKLDPNEASYFDLDKGEMEKAKISDINQSYSKEEISNIINSQCKKMITILEKEGGNTFEKLCNLFQMNFLLVPDSFLFFLEKMNI